VTAQPLASRRTPLTAREAVAALLYPKSVALVGVSADEEKFSGQPLRNLQTAGFPGTVHPVNRRGGQIRGVPALTAVDQLPPDIDVALVMVPARDCVATVEALGAASVGVAVIAVSGFAELGTAEGAALQADLAAAGQASGVRLVGPNCNGVYNTAVPLPLGYNYTHSQKLPAGDIALVSHSGAMLGAFAPLLTRYGHGLSSFVSCGNEVDLALGDYLEYLLDDERTAAIALIVDAVEDGPAFRRAAREARRRGKPLVALKIGNSASGTRATLAHSSRLAGSLATYEAVFAADGVLTVPTLETLAIASCLAADGRQMSRPSVVATSTSGAGGILLADTLTAAGLDLPALDEATVVRMRPGAGFAQVINPFDIGAAGAQAIGDHLRALASDPGAGALVFYLTPVPTQSWRDALADGVAAIAAERPDLPILLVSPSPLGESEARSIRRVGVPVAGSLLDAVAVLRALRPPTPTEAPTEAGASAPPAALSEPQSKRLLTDLGLTFPAELTATSLEQARRAAAEIGYPVVLKGAGAGIAHKSEHGLVALDVPDEATLTGEYARLDRLGRDLDPAGFEGVVVSSLVPAGVEVMVGVVVDRGFGPMVLVGGGGVLSELMGDVALAPAPLTAAEAARLLAATRVDRLLTGYRGAAAADRTALVDLLVRASEAAVRLGDDIEAVDLNPVRVLPEGQGVRILDALVVRSTR
jgi:acyl-CoA synthetase (NDP forming)